MGTLLFFKNALIYFSFVNPIRREVMKVVLRASSVGTSLKESLKRYHKNLVENGFKDAKLKKQNIYLTIESLEDLCKINKVVCNDLILTTSKDSDELLIQVYDDYIE